MKTVRFVTHPSVKQILTLQISGEWVTGWKKIAAYLKKGAQDLAGSLKSDSLYRNRPTPKESRRAVNEAMIMMVKSSETTEYTNDVRRYYNVGGGRRA
jgi:hypothetical protein